MTIPGINNQISIGNLLTIATGAVALLAAGVTIQSDFRALAQRVDKGEFRDDKTADALDAAIDARP